MLHSEAEVPLYLSHLPAKDLPTSQDLRRGETNELWGLLRADGAARLRKFAAPSAKTAVESQASAPFITPDNDSRLVMCYHVFSFDKG